MNEKEEQLKELEAAFINAGICMKDEKKQELIKTLCELFEEDNEEV